MRKLIILALLAVAVAAIFAIPSAAKPPGTNGKIVTNSDNLLTGEEQVYTVDPDGSDQQLVFNNSEVGQWSPDGTRMALVTQLGPPEILLFNPDTGSTVDLGLPDALYPGLSLFCTVWSPDGARLA
ncbi:MAG: TolB family protein, partial [Gaiellaceae bacterium]